MHRNDSGRKSWQGLEQKQNQSVGNNGSIDWGCLSDFDRPARGSGLAASYTLASWRAPRPERAAWELTLGLADRFWLASSGIPTWIHFRTSGRISNAPLGIVIHVSGHFSRRRTSTRFPCGSYAFNSFVIPENSWFPRIKVMLHINWIDNENKWQQIGSLQTTVDNNSYIAHHLSDQQ
jgi:hypothetical protein